MLQPSLWVYQHPTRPTTMTRPAAIGGPCSHCHTRVSPCWRKGPVDTSVPGNRAVLCNACGSRFLTKGKEGLVGYLPNLRSRLTASRQKPTQRRRSLASHRVAVHAPCGQTRKSRAKILALATLDAPRSSPQVVVSKAPPFQAFSSASFDEPKIIIATYAASMRRRPRKQIRPSAAAK